MKNISLKKFLFIILASSSLLLANALPNSITTTISSISPNGNIQLSSKVPSGMSGIVVHNYGNGLSAITHSSISQGNGVANLLPYTAILHKNIPNIQTEAQVGDKVVFGNFYNNALLIAPNQNIYSRITKTYKRAWLHPDAYALDFMEEGETTLSLESIQRFSKLNQVGLVLIVVPNRVLILDPISKQYLGAIPIQTDEKNAMAPFFARFKQMDVSAFGFSSNTYPPYYQSVAGLK